MWLFLTKPESRDSWALEGIYDDGFAARRAKQEFAALYGANTQLRLVFVQIYAQIDADEQESAAK